MWFWILIALGLLIVLLLANCAGFVVGVATNPQIAAVASAQDEIDAALGERDVALAAEQAAERRAVELEGELDALGTEMADVEAREAEAQESLLTLEGERDEALAAVESLESRVSELEAELQAAASQSQPAPVADPSALSDPASGSGATGGSGSTDGGNSAPATAAYFANCSAARAAGQAPLYVGDPGYRSGLDRDGDGVACE